MHHETLQAILEAVGRVVEADLFAILLLDAPDRLVTVAARGRLATPRLEGLRVGLESRPTLRAALGRDEPTLLSEHHHGREPDTFEGAVPLPGDHSCLVAPLRDGGRLLGAMTLDAAACGVFSGDQVRAVGAFALLAARVVAAEEAADRLALRVERLAAERASLDPEGPAGATLVGRSPSFRAAVERLRLVAPTPAAVLVTGETGTGKEQAARAVHQWSPRARGPFIALNCSALQPELALSELFGHEKGAFTGAHRRRAGRFELADGGTLFLDEIAELPPGAQAQLLRVLQEGTFERVGGSITLRSDVRIVAATHRDLAEEVRRGRFREDLLFRIGVFPVHLPPLRERPGDVALLAAHFLSRLRERLGMPELALAGDALRALEAHDWPGNVRELANVLERAAILAGGRRIEPRHLDLSPPGAPETRGAGSSPAETLVVPPGYRLPRNLSRLDRVQAEEILRALGEAGGRIAGKGGAASLLGLPPGTLRSRIARLGLRS